MPTEIKAGPANEVRVRVTGGRVELTLPETATPGLAYELACDPKLTPVPGTAEGRFFAANPADETVDLIVRLDGKPAVA